jgi:Tol biopolymer transport system component
MKRVGAPVVSPDGKWVVFSVIEPSYDPKEQATDLWITATDGNGKPRKITFTKSSEGGVAWSQDSKRIAFAAKREGDEQNQIYVLNVAEGGEAQRVTNVSTGAGSPEFSPNGSMILVTSSVFRDAADDDANKKAAKDAKDRKTNVRVYESFPVRAWDRWIDPEKQIHLFVQPLDSTGKARDLLAGTKLAGSPGFSGTLGGEGGENMDVVWSPDGQSVVFTISTARNTSAYANVPTDLYRVSIGGGEPERIAHAEGGYNDPKFSPDGKTLYAEFNPDGNKTYYNTRIVAFDWPAVGNHRVVTPEPFDRSAGSWP